MIAGASAYDRENMYRQVDAFLRGLLGIDAAPAKR